MSVFVAEPARGTDKVNGKVSLEIVTAKGASTSGALPPSLMVAVSDNGSPCVTEALVVSVPVTPTPVCAVERIVTVDVCCTSVARLASLTTTDSGYVPGAVVPSGQVNVVVVDLPGTSEAMVEVPLVPAIEAVTVTFASVVAPLVY